MPSYHKYISLSGYAIGAARNQVSPAIHTTSQKLLLQSNFIDESSSGLYSIIGGGSRVFHKICALIDDEMRQIGAHKIVLPSLSHHKPWMTSGRWDDMGPEMYKFKDRNGIDHCLSPTHEEAVTSIVANVSPVKHESLPIKLYQIGRKFRDEMRPKGGLLRCKEFEMKDLYTFDKDIESSQSSYNEVCAAYQKIFSKLQLPFVKVEGSTGTMGGLLSDEYHVLSAVGEDSLHTCVECGKGFNEEMISKAKVMKENCQRSDCPNELTKNSGIEIAHAFLLGTKYSSVFKANCSGSDNKIKPLVMGCFGIGISRLLSAVLEGSSSSHNMKWPSLISPHQISVIPQTKGYKSDHTLQLATELCSDLSDLSNLGYNEVVLDDRIKTTIGYRVKDAQLVGYPYIVTLGKKALNEDPLYEFINVHKNETEFLSKQRIVELMAGIKTIPLMHA